MGPCYASACSTRNDGRWEIDVCITLSREVAEVILRLQSYYRRPASSSWKGSIQNEGWADCSQSSIVRTVAVQYLSFLSKDTVVRNADLPSQRLCFPDQKRIILNDFVFTRRKIHVKFSIKFAHKGNARLVANLQNTSWKITFT